MTAGPDPPAAAFDVVLAAPGDKVIRVIKAVRELTDLGLKDSKDLVDGAPSVIFAGVTSDLAETAATELQAAGAVVEVRPSGSGSSAPGPATAHLGVLARLGALSPDELAHARAKLAEAAAPSKMVATIRGLFDLYKAGALTESEYNAKKWDILSSPGMD